MLFLGAECSTIPTTQAEIRTSPFPICSLLTVVSRLQSIAGTHADIHGDADCILPPAATSRRQAKMIKHAKLAEIPGGPHGLCWTRRDHVNAELEPFVE